MYNIGFWSDFWGAIADFFMSAWTWLIDCTWTFIAYVIEAVCNLLVLPLTLPTRLFEVLSVCNWFFPVMETVIMLEIFLVFACLYWGIKFVYNTIVGLL